MRNILTLSIIVALGLFLLTGCSNTGMPAFPEDEIQHHFLVDVAGVDIPSHVLSAVTNPQDIKAKAEVACLKFNIVSYHPYKISFDSEVDISNCHGVGGFTPSGTKALINWIDEIIDWAETKKKCLK